MKAHSLIFFFAFVAVPNAHAYLPPAFFVYSKLVEPKIKSPPITGVALTVARPQTAGTEEILGSISITEWKSSSGGWPILSLIFDGDQEALEKAVSNYGLTVLKETDLLRIDKDKAASMKDPPHPFYKTDPTMSLKRTRQTYAWVHSNADGKSVWVEKDSFLPLKVAGLCPSAASGLGFFLGVLAYLLLIGIAPVPVQAANRSQPVQRTLAAHGHPIEQLHPAD